MAACSVGKAKGWAWVAGASEGLGLAFAEQLAARGHDLVLFARRAALLDEVAKRIQSTHNVEVLTRAIDMRSADLSEQLMACIPLAPPSTAIYNAAYSPAGAFLGQTTEQLMQVVDVNVRGPLLWTHALGNAMRTAGGGQLLLMSSLAGAQGTPTLSTYAASKAFNTILAEGLWWELKEANIDVLVCCAGAVRTPGYAMKARGDAPGTLDPDEVARCALQHLGKGPRVVPGWINRVASVLVGRWLPRRLAIAIMARATVDLRESALHQT